MLPRHVGSVVRVAQHKAIHRRFLNKYRAFASAVEEGELSSPLHPTAEERLTSSHSTPPPIHRVENNLKQDESRREVDEMSDELKRGPWFTDPYHEEELESVYDRSAKASTITNIHRCTKDLNKLIDNYRLKKESQEGKVSSFVSELAAIGTSKPTNRFLERLVEYMLERKLSAPQNSFMRSKELANALTLVRRKAIEIRLDVEESNRILNAQDVQNINEDAASLTQHLIDNCPAYTLHKVLRFLHEFVGDDNWKPKKLRLDKQFGVHYWLVASRLGEFLCVPNHPELTIVKSEKIQKQKAQWEENRRNTIEIMMRIQALLQEHSLTDANDVQQRSTDNETVSVESAETNSMINSSKKEADTNDSEGERDSGNVIEELDESLSDNEVEKSLPQIERISRPAPVINAYYKRVKAHSKFEAIVALDDASPQLNVDPYQVFVDNLPIDVTEEKLFEWYGRCGSIKSIDIFNLRPELDPGPLPRSGQIERRKRQIRALAKASATTWQRPCTPVYALINFEHEKGYNTALDPSLKLFGMILERHQVRSIAAQDTPRLFIENLPDGTRCTHIQSHLQSVLRDGLTVVQSGGGMSKKLIKSCEIKFQTFEEAYVARQAILRSEIEGVTINWFRTRDDAELWWKRELGFE